MQSLSDDFSVETLYYQQSISGGGNTPRYNGLVSAIHYTRTSDSTDDTWLYGYDATGRLQSAALGQTVSPSLRVRCQRQHPEIDGEWRDLRPLPMTEGSDFLASAQGVTFTAAPSGEVLSAASRTFGYDFSSRLTTRISDSQANQTLSVVYGGSAQRLSKTLTDAGGNTLSWRRYVAGPGKRALLEQALDASTQKTQSFAYIYGPQGIMAMQVDGVTYFVLTDHEQSVRLLVQDAAATPTALFDYLPFGQAKGTPGGSDPALLVYRYTGQEWDEETQLYNYRHRLYDPAVERFYAPDPAHQYASPYVYTGDDPLQRTDPSGEFSWGTIVSSVEIGVGAALTVTGVGAPLGVGLIVSGAAGLNYSLKTKHFNAGQFFQIETAAAVSTAEVEAGVAVTVLGGPNMASGALTGAGFAGLTDTFTQINTNPNGKFNWAEWGIAEGAGAITGAVSAGVGDVLSSAATSGFSMLGSSSVEAGVDAASDVAVVGGGDVEEAAAPSLGARFMGRLVGTTTGRFVGAFAGTLSKEAATDAVQKKKFEWGQSLKQAAVIGGEQALSQFIAVGVSGGVSVYYTDDIKYLTYPERFMRPPLNSAWTQLIHTS